MDRYTVTTKYIFVLLPSHQLLSDLSHIYISISLCVSIAVPTTIVLTRCPYVPFVGMGVRGPNP
jgi:hypothetical protein